MDPYLIEDHNKWLEMPKTLKTLDAYCGAHPHLKPQHDATTRPLDPNFPLSNMTLAIYIGGTGQGKTYQTGYTTQKIPFDIIFSVKSTEHLDQTNSKMPLRSRYPIITYDDVEESVQELFRFFLLRYMISHYMIQLSHIIHMTCTIDNIEDIIEKLDKIIDELAGAYPLDFYKLSNRVLVIYDDCGTQRNQMHKKSSSLVNLALNRRHPGINMLFCLQRFNQIENDIRANASDKLLTSGVSENDVKLLIPDGGNLPYKDIIDRNSIWPLYCYLTSRAPYAVMRIFSNEIYADEKKLDKALVHKCINLGYRLDTVKKAFSKNKISESDKDYYVAEIIAEGEEMLS